MHPLSIYLGRLFFRRQSRRFRSWGLHPFLGYLGVPLLFILGSYMAFEKLIYPAYLYSLCGLGMVYTVHHRQDLRFLKTHLSSHLFQNVKTAIGVLVVLPFVVFLCWKMCFVHATLLLLATLFVGFLPHFYSKSATIPLPFLYSMYEFPVGWRRSWFAILGLYILSGIGVNVGNFNLCMVAIGCMGLLGIGYITPLEPDTYIWVYKTKPKIFILQKIKHLALSFLILVLPQMSMAMIQFPEHTSILAVFVLLITLFLATIQMMKYAYYPNQIHIVGVILLVLCIVFPPAYLGISPVYFSKSTSNLKTILY